MTETASNPLIAAREDSTEWYSGVTLFESVADVKDAISSGSWIEAGVGIAAAGMEVAAMVVDPIGTLAGFGVSFLIEHVQPLSDALDWVAGDPDQITAYAKTWENVATQVSSAVDTHKQAVEADIANWSGASASAYRARAAETSDALAAASAAATAASQAIEMAGGIVAAVRMTVRDIVAQAVGRLAVWAAEAVFSLGTATPVIAAQAATFVAKTMTTIARLFSKVASTFAKLKPLLAKLNDAWQAIARTLGKGGKSTPSSTKKSSTDTTTASTDSPKKTTDPDSPSKPGDKSPDTTPASTDPPSKTGDPDTQRTPDSSGKPENQAKADEGAGDKATEGGPKNTQDDKDVTECNDPVDVATGEFLLPETDLSLPGVLPLVLLRRHRSSYRFGRWFGPSWSSTLDMRVVIEADTVTFIGEHGLLLVYPHAEPDKPVLPSNGGQRWTMTRTEAGGYRVHDPERELTWHFDAAPALGGLDTLLGNYAISAVTDRHHNRIRFHYDTDGAPVEITHSGGYRVRVTTDDGRVTALAVVGTDPKLSPSDGSAEASPDAYAADAAQIRTQVRTFVYEAGELVSVTNGVGATTHYSYDDAHRLTGWTDSNGNRMVNTYDLEGRVVAQHGNSNILNATFDYFTTPDNSLHRTIHTDSLGAATTFVFNADLRLIEQIDPSGARTRTDYDDDRRPTRVIAPDGAVTTYHYTPDGDLTTITRPDHAQIRITHHARNRPSAILNVDGTVHRQEWDTGGNLSAVIDPAGNRTEYTHHACGAIASVTEPTGAVTTIDVDAAGLPVRVTDPHGGTTTIERDHFGRPTAVTDPLGATVRYIWSGEGKLLRRIDPDDIGESWVWDGELNLTAHVDRNGGITRYTYGAFDLLTARTEPDGAMTHYTWDTQRRLTTVANPIGHTWHYRYDPAGRLTSETDYTGATTHYTHDPAGRINTVTPATGVTRHHTHDILGRLVSITADTGEWIHYTHDLAGRIKTAVSGVNETRTHTLQFTHTRTGRLASQQLDDQPPMVFTHDEFGRRTSRTTPSGATTTWTHDVSGRVTAMTTDGHAISFTHDPLGRTTGWRIGNISIDRAFTPVGHTTHQVVTAHLPSTPTPAPSAPEPQILRRDDYTWRPDGYLTAHTTTHPETAPDHRQYTLDPIGRVTAITRNGALAEHYSYDKLSNITSGGVVTPDATTPGPGHPTASGQPGSHQGYPAPPGLPPNPAAPQQHSPADTRREYHNNLLIRDGRHQYHYDPAGRLIRKTTTRISRKPDVWHYRYNAFDQLTDVYTPEGQWWHYTYDALGRRTTKQRLTTGGVPVDQTGYVWETKYLIEQISNISVVSWLFHPATHTPLAQSKKIPSGKGEFVAIATDTSGAPVELLDPISGRVEATAITSLWGGVAWRGTSDTLLRFQGQQFDPESGLHYNLHRTYDPDSGRFLTNDPIGLAPSANPNTYPRNPITWTDPLGLVPCRTEDGTYLVRQPNPAYPPDPRLDELMNRDYHENTDCSEIAELMLNRADGEGSIIRYEPQDRFGSISTPEDMGRQMTPYVFHEVYTDGRYVYDPRFSTTPVPIGDFHRIMKSLNPGIRWSG
ncbi:RHS repeat-associated core domain-containing protein [Nocardia cyriacigeorgica]|uniref:Putative Rhs protein n=1 Tax=Nocardia cyriacigeorgica (strain GUH-2) TaxID=1127134 RepID=H6R8J8_NOCCG|nr:RHS repeat-associated core domain-containing protein [Nocardia cyriacigeorgica]MBF6289358.1 RHS repeat protein [Nocardia cyriacigeorgica]CCF66145.1 putative Rhs protein [Nocardia cyriacigeorgica GUH-2]